MTLLEALRTVGDTQIAAEESMAKHTTFRIGGKADIFAKPATADSLAQIIKICRDHAASVTVLGGGSNILVRDEGIAGVVLSTLALNKIETDGNRVTAQAGASLSALSEAACKAGLSGLEFASGIPGTVGGAVYMNAGAYEQSISDVCEAVTTLSADTLVVYAASQMKFDYRYSILQENNALALSAAFVLRPGDPLTIKSTMRELTQRRKATQPLDCPSAGSTFKRPPGHFAGKLIQDSGLQGYAIGGAQVSDKHAGFIVNTGNATADDVLRLIEHIKETVYARFKVPLEIEIRVI